MINGKNILSREAILRATDLKSERVEVPEWGGCVTVRSMTGFERDAFEASLFDGKGASRKEKLANLRARLVAFCVVDAEGKRIFSDSDAEALGRKSAAALDRVFAVAQRLNGLGHTQVEELAKN